MGSHFRPTKNGRSPARDLPRTVAVGYVSAQIAIAWRTAAQHHGHGTDTLEGIHKKDAPMWWRRRV
eukprot:5759235-Pyramimonas_sp.AAC.1